MTHNFAQITNPGASNAEDFQPPTGNPQNNSASPLQQQGNLQGSVNTQEALQEQRNAEIIVPSTQNDLAGIEGRLEATTASPSGGLSLLLALMAAVVILSFAHFIRRRGKVRILPDMEELEDTPVSVKEAAVKSKSTKAKKPTKTKPKKTVKKKKHRKHR